MARALVIVESVAKATRIQGMLGSDYIVKPSIGHIRDLPESASEIPASVKSEKWARLGINVNDHFKPVYVVSSDRKKVVAELKAALKEVDELYLATDEDREGEAIAWHLQEVLNPKVPVKRMVFHEITPAAIEKAVSETRDLDLRLVDAQEGRRFLDRLVGYEVSPVLWRAVDKARSAGRVQSVAIRLVCERERERMKFVSANWFDVEATLRATSGSFPPRSTPSTTRRSRRARTSTPTAPSTTPPPCGCSAGPRRRGWPTRSRVVNCACSRSRPRLAPSAPSPRS